MFYKYSSCFINNNTKIFWYCLTLVALNVWHCLNPAWTGKLTQVSHTEKDLTLSKEKCPSVKPLCFTESSIWYLSERCLHKSSVQPLFIFSYKCCCGTVAHNLRLPSIAVHAGESIKLYILVHQINLTSQRSSEACLEFFNNSSAHWRKPLTTGTLQ